jgi:hypothetical protein
MSSSSAVLGVLRADWKLAVRIPDLKFLFADKPPGMAHPRVARLSSSWLPFLGQATATKRRPEAISDEFTIHAFRLGPPDRLERAP